MKAIEKIRELIAKEDDPRTAAMLATGYAAQTVYQEAAKRMESSRAEELKRFLIAEGWIGEQSWLSK